MTCSFGSTYIRHQILTLESFSCAFVSLVEHTRDEADGDERHGGPKERRCSVHGRPLR